jgi:adenylate kinase
MNLVIFGPPGAGKGTYAAELAEQFDIPAIATGDIFRAEVKSGSELGKKVAVYLQSGKLVPDEIVDETLRNWLNKPENNRGFILDGYPRTVEQAQALDAMTKIDAILNMSVPELILIERLSNRRICPKCGAIYNIKHSPKPKVDAICDKCGAALYQRPDDRPEVIKERLEVYRKQTQPLIKYYKDKNAKFITIVNRQVDADIKIVTRRIMWRMKQAHVLDPKLSSLDS